ncbi:MAG: hypothetical protein CVU04_03390 [Bacteroidetes bacterium HGW-Bacteroidetes-20]|nr:MAG: hypothetical protein CVU04_03390 [Bacteroidetes bacterium HGW-Bacteroidetes-20]
MKKSIKFLLIGTLILITTNSCLSPIQKIEKYINKNCNFEIDDTCNIDIQKALRVEYDTMYIFYSLIPTSGVQRIIGTSDFKNSNKSENALLGKDSDIYFIFLKKDGKVVYEDKYHSSSLIYLSSDNFVEVKGMGFFDGDSVQVSGEMNTNPIFQVVKANDNSYRLE